MVRRSRFMKAKTSAAFNARVDEVFALIKPSDEPGFSSAPYWFIGNGCHIRSMAVLNSPLTPEQFESLRQISLPMGRIVPDSHKVRLLNLGFAVERFGRWILTPLGQERLALRR